VKTATVEVVAVEGAAVDGAATAQGSDCYRKKWQ